MRDRYVWAGILLTAFLLASGMAFMTGARAQEVATGQGLICNTPAQVAEFVAAYTGDDDAALQTVNATENVCGVMMVAYYAGEEVDTVDTPKGPANIVRIAVIAVNVGLGWQQVPPLAQYTLFLIRGRDT